MSSETILSNNETLFMRKCLQEGLRIDGRRLNSFREVKIDFGLDPGSVEVCLGQTRVYATISCELGTPNPSRPNEGIIEFNLTFPNYLKKKQDESDEIVTIIEKSIKQSNAIDLESLCVLSSEQVWVFSVNISVIQIDGNVIDCANLAVMCALKHHRRPDVTVIGNQVTVYSMLDRHPVPLSVHHLPICVTLAQIIIDPENGMFHVFDIYLIELLHFTFLSTNI